MTQRALTSVLCHEALHNLARRVRVGNPFLAEDTEHIAMALLGDPQLVHDTWTEVFFWLTELVNLKYSKICWHTVFFGSYT